MSYDWEKIFEGKTNKELYDIVIGKRVLSKEAVKFAKIELENRSFDFENMEANKAGWEISSLIEEENLARSEITGRRAKHFPLKYLLFIIGGILIISFALNYYGEGNVPLEIVIYFIAFGTGMTLLNNYQAKKQKQKQHRRLEKIKELEEKLLKENLLSKDSSIYKELKRHKINEKQSVKTIEYIGIGIATIVIIAYILSIIF